MRNWDVDWSVIGDKPDPVITELPAGRRLVTTPLSNIKMKNALWLYDKRIPVGAISLIAGREGIGKSTILTDLLAKITQGTLPGVYKGTPHSVGIIAAEDDYEAVIAPRFYAAGADLSRVHRVEVEEDGMADTVSVPIDLVKLEEWCAETDVVALDLDPAMSVISGKLDTHIDREVRKALDPLQRFCHRSNIAAIGLIHVNKSATTDALTAVMGSKAFVAVPRSVLFCMNDPDDAESYLFGHPKSNLARKQPTIGYQLSGYRINRDGEEPIDTSKVCWGGEDTRSINEAMSQERIDRVTGELATEILEWVEGENRAVTTAEIEAHFAPDTKAGTIRKNLERMVNRGKLTQPMRAHYAINHHAALKDDESSL